jgi:futalosine hydrolase
MMAACIVAALDGELVQIREELNARSVACAGRSPYYIGSLSQNPIYLVTIGVGVVSAAMSLGRFLAENEIDRVIMTGSAGALPHSGLNVGDVVVAASETLAELGVCVGEGLADANSLNLPELSQTILLDEDLGKSITESADRLCRVSHGAFLSVAGVSSHRGQALARADRFGALVENMEGYALALAGMTFGISVAEVRGVSNFAGSRDKSTWNLNLANTRAQSVVLNYLRRRT